MICLPVEDELPTIQVVTDTAFWAALGRELRAVRERLNLTPLAFAQRHRGVVSKNTIDEIENGFPGQNEKLTAYCRALKIPLADIVRTVLEKEADTDALSADAKWVAVMFEKGPDPELRGAMRGMAQGQALLLAAGLSRLAELSPDKPPAAPGMTRTASAIPPLSQKRKKRSNDDRP